MKLIAQGAEAKLYKDGKSLIKYRAPKEYRIPEIDGRLRKSRTRREAKILQKLAELDFPSPRIAESDDEKIVMGYIDGKKLSSILEKTDYMKVSRELGRKIRILHDNHIIHGDLTTSNFILKDQAYFVDFGLGFFSLKTEDKAVDLHLLRQALEAKHHTIGEACFREVLKGYHDRTVEKRLEIVERRGRYKSRV